MRHLLTAVLALVASVIASSATAAALADWTRAGQEFIIVFFAIGPVAIFAAMVMMLAALMTRPGAISTAALILLGLLALMFAALAVIGYLTTPTTAAAARDVALSGCVVGVFAVIVAVQWAVFRWRARPATSPTGRP